MEALDGTHVKSILVLLLTGISSYFILRYFILIKVYNTFCITIFLFFLFAEVFIKVNGVYGTEQINNTSLPLYEMTVKPHEKVCFVCPVPKKSMAGIIWKHGDNKVYRDDTRLPSEQHLSLAVDTCNSSLRNHTLEISNISTSVPYGMFTCWSKTQLKAKFLVKIQGK